MMDHGIQSSKGAFAELLFWKQFIKISHFHEAVEVNEILYYIYLFILRKPVHASLLLLLFL